jgi:exonuclease SbcC
MKLISLELENVKSYKQAHIDFADGISAICGHNGAGKSTILEAIGFVLFDYLQTSQADLVRQGEKTASIRLDVEKDGKIYSIYRSCGSSSKYTVKSGKDKLTINKGDTISWLYEFLGVSAGEELPTIFKDAVGVPQGLLTTAFLQTAANRKQIFAPLLHVDAYERAWTNLRDTERSVTSKIHEIEVDMATLRSQVSSLSDLEQKKAEIELQIEELEQKLEDLNRESETETKVLKWQEELEEKLKQSRHQLEIYEMQLFDRQQEIGKAKKDCAEAQNALEIVNNTRSDHAKYAECSEKLNILHTNREQRDQLLNKKSLNDSFLENALGRIINLDKQRDACLHAQQQSEELKPKVSEYEIVQAELAEVTANLRDIDKIKEELTSLIESRDHFRSAIDQVKAELAQKTNLENLIAENREKSTNLASYLAEIREQGITSNAAIESLDERIEILSGDSSTCPVCDGELTPKHRESLLASIAATKSDLEGRNEDNRELWKEINDQLKKITDEIAAFEAQLKDLSSESTLKVYEETVSKQDQQIVDGEEKVSHYDDLAEKLLELRQKEQDLREIIHNLAVYKAQAARMIDVQMEIDGLDTEIEEIKEELAQTEEALKEFDDLDDHIKHWASKMDDMEEGNAQFLANQVLAEKYPEKKQAVELLQAQILQLERDIKSENAELERTSGLYSAETHRIAKEKTDKLSSDIQFTTAKVEFSYISRKETDAKLLTMREQAIELDEKQHLFEHLQKVSATIGISRQWIRDAGPEITKMLVASISINADMLFSEIMQDPTAHLEWHEDYDIVVSNGNQTRHFNQLSGGEQMSAALAVRLSLLKEISNIDIAFFDEPTVNLDAQRRESLAQQILNVRGFTQLFVISHDDSFEQGTDHIIRINKEEGESIVYAG